MMNPRNRVLRKSISSSASAGGLSTRIQIYSLYLRNIYIYIIIYYNILLNNRIRICTYIRTRKLAEPSKIWRGRYLILSDANGNLRTNKNLPQGYSKQYETWLRGSVPRCIGIYSSCACNNMLFLFLEVKPSWIKTSLFASQSRCSHSCLSENVKAVERRVARLETSIQVAFRSLRHVTRRQTPARGAVK
jgi:hypothetical protein